MEIKTNSAFKACLCQLPYQREMGGRAAGKELQEGDEEKGNKEAEKRNISYVSGAAIAFGDFEEFCH